LGGIIGAIDFVQGGFDVGASGRSDGRRLVAGVEGETAGQATELEGKLVEFDNVTQAREAGTFEEFGNGSGSSPEHFLVQEPFLNSKSLSALFP
jgi:hypothetical protein